MEGAISVAKRDEQGCGAGTGLKNREILIAVLVEVACGDSDDGLAGERVVGAYSGQAAGAANRLKGPGADSAPIVLEANGTGEDADAIGSGGGG